MYGAMLGDIIGAPYEFNRGPHKKDFGPLFIKKASEADSSRYTDDSLMTVAVCDALLKVKGKNMSDEDIKKEITKSILSWANAPEYKHIYGEYGNRFRSFLSSSNPKPYNSCGNGSAMRVSAAGYLFDTIEETRKYARLSAEVSHNHPEGVRGAEAVAAVIFLARTGKTKEEIRKYVIDNFASKNPKDENYVYNLTQTVDQIRPGYRHYETCQECIPQAITCFLEADSYEDAIRNAISIGGDTDTIGCIVGSMAEAFYGVPKNLVMQCKKYITPGMQAVTNRFYTTIANLDTVKAEDFDTTKTSLLTLSEQSNKFGNLTNDTIIGYLNEQIESDKTKEKGKKYAEFVKKAITAGYTIDDADAFWIAQTILDDVSPNADQNLIEIKNRTQSVLDEVISNIVNGEPKPISIASRTANIRKLQTALEEFSNNNNGISGLKKRSLDILMDIKINDRVNAPLNPGDLIRMSNNVHEIYDILETTNPSSVRSSSEFKAMRASLKALEVATEGLDQNNPESVANLVAAEDKLKKDTLAYVTYKRNQLRNGRNRSRVEMLRVSAAESLLDRLNKNNITITREVAPSAKIRDLIVKAKTAIVQRDEANKVKAAAVLLTDKLLKETGEVIDDNLFQDSLDTMLDNDLFINTVSQVNIDQLQIVIENGEFEKAYTQVAEQQILLDEYRERQFPKGSKYASAIIEEIKSSAFAVKDAKKLTEEQKDSYIDQFLTIIAVRQIADSDLGQRDKLDKVHMTPAKIKDRITLMKADTVFQGFIKLLKEDSSKMNDAISKATTGHGGGLDTMLRDYIKNLPPGKLVNAPLHARYLPTIKERIEILKKQAEQVYSNRKELASVEKSMKSTKDPNKCAALIEKKDKLVTYVMEHNLKHLAAEIIHLRNIACAEKGKVDTIDKPIPTFRNADDQVKMIVESTADYNHFVDLMETPEAIRLLSAGHCGEFTDYIKMNLPVDKEDPRINKLIETNTIGSKFNTLKAEAISQAARLEAAIASNSINIAAHAKAGKMIIAEYLLLSERCVNKKTKTSDDTLLRTTIPRSELKELNEKGEEYNPYIKKIIKNLKPADIVESLKSIATDSRTVALGKLAGKSEALSKAKTTKVAPKQTKSNEGPKKK